MKLKLQFLTGILAAVIASASLAAPCEGTNCPRYDRRGPVFHEMRLPQMRSALGLFYVSAYQNNIRARKPITVDEADTIIATALSKNDEIMNMLLAFNEADGDNNKAITVDELVHQFDQKQRGLKNKRDKEYYDDDDDDDDDDDFYFDDIDHDDYKRGRLFHYRLPDVMMHKYDANRDLRLSQEEYENLLAGHKAYHQTVAKALQAIKTADLNNDGYLTAMEIHHAIGSVVLANAPKVDATTLTRKAPKVEQYNGDKKDHKKKHRD